MQKPWGPNEPNSTHQRWSRWTFTITSPTRRPSGQEVLDNFRRFVRVVFRSSIGEARVRMNRGDTYELSLHIEGPPVHDAAYRAAMARTWLARFVRPGFGPDATMTMDATLLAGSYEDGRPSTHLIVAPPIVFPAGVQS